MGVRSVLGGLKRTVKRVPWLFVLLKTIKNGLEKSPLFPHLLRLAVPMFPSWPGLRIRLAHHLAQDGKRDESIAIARHIAAMPDVTHQMLMAVQPVFHLQGLPDEGSELLRRAEHLRLQENQVQQVDALGMRFFSPHVFHNIGHLSLIDSFLKAEEIGLLPKCQNVMVGPMAHYSNPAYARLWGQRMTLIEDPNTITMLDPLRVRLEQHLGMISYADGTMKDHVPFLRDVSLGLPPGHQPLLELTDAERRRGRERLTELGIPEDAWFVGLHARQGRDGMRGLRDAEIASYRLAVEEVHRRGGWVVRMGDPSMPPMSEMPGAIDYIHSGLQTDWMDVYLWAEGKFFIGTGSGPCVVPTTFGKPVVISNWVPMGNRMPGRDDLLLPKQMRRRSDGNLLTLEERIGADVAYIESRDALDALGIDIIDNGPEEIRDAVIEMFERLDGTAVYSETHEALQAKSDHWAEQVDAAPTRIARVFMDKYAELF